MFLAVCVSIFAIAVLTVHAVFRGSRQFMEPEKIVVKNHSSTEKILVKNDSSTSLKNHENIPVANFSLAYHESMGFFDDITDSEWKLLKQKVENMYPNVLGDPYNEDKQEAGAFWQSHYEPDFSCRHELRIGPSGDGGKWVCDPHRIRRSDNCLVYSVGSEGDVGFEEGVFDDIGEDCEVHTFDMADYGGVVNPTGAIYHKWGISEQHVDGAGKAFKTLEETVKLLGHTGRTIDLFKIDCEGCEWNTFPTFFDSGVVLRQILIELHAGKQRKIKLPVTVDFFKDMYRHGYVIYHKEVNTQFWSGAIEYGFLKLHNDFFDGIADLQSITR